MDATRITRQLEETIDEFERQKIRDIKVSSAVLYVTGRLVGVGNIIKVFLILTSRKYLATL